MICPPISQQSAQQLNQRCSEAWNSDDPKAVLNLLSKSIIWEENGRSLVGRDKVWHALKAKWQRSLHFYMNQTLIGFTDDTITVKFSSEWQDSKHGQWFQEQGMNTLHIDFDGLINSITARTEQRLISSVNRISRTLGQTKNRGARI